MSLVTVANHAGVSTATVSRVLNDFPGVGPETARQVRSSLQALNYDISKLKRNRKNGNLRVVRSRKKVKSIAILTIGHTRQWLQLPVMATTVAGISRGAKEYGFQLILDEVFDATKLSDTVIKGKVDGAIVFLPSFVQATAAQEVFTTIKRHLPLVWVMGNASGLFDIDHVLPDNFAVGQLALKYLKDNGCQDVAYMCLHPDWLMMQVRGQSFASAAREAHLRCSSYLVSSDKSQSDAYSGRAVVESKLEDLIDALVKAKPRPNGIFISNDASTVQVYPLLQGAGIMPGRDITIVSCDNEEVRLSGLHPRPASIDVGAEEAGWRAVHRLASRLENTQEPAVQISVAPKLVLEEPSVIATGEVTSKKR